MDAPQQKFISTMKVYCLNSLLYGLNDFIFGIVLAATAQVLYKNEKFSFKLDLNYEFVYYFTHIRNNLGLFFYAFGGLMDIYFVWGRIQIFKPNYTFLLMTPVSFFIFYNLFSNVYEIKFKSLFFTRNSV